MSFRCGVGLHKWSKWDAFHRWCKRCRKMEFTRIGEAIVKGFATMIEVTQDAEHAEWLYNNLPVRVPSWNAIGPEARAAMVHNVERVRIAAEKAGEVALATAYQCGYDAGEEHATKALLNRLRGPASLERMAQAVGRETVKRDERGRMFDDLPEEDKSVVLEILDAALADALETKR